MINKFLLHIKVLKPFPESVVPFIYGICGTVCVYVCMHTYMSGSKLITTPENVEFQIVSLVLILMQHICEESTEAILFS